MYIFWFIPFIIVLCLILITVFRKKHTVVLCAGILLSVTVVLLLYNTAFFYKSESVSVGNGDSEIEFQLDCHRIYASPDFYRFISSKTVNELLEIIQETYPQAYYDEAFEAIYIIQDNQIYSVALYDKKFFLTLKRNYYTVSINRILVESGENADKNKYLPFPLNALKGEYIGAHTEYEILCEKEKLFAFYGQLSDTEIKADEIIVPQKDNVYKLTFDNRKLYIEILK